MRDAAHCAGTNPLYVRHPAACWSVMWLVINAAARHLAPWMSTCYQPTPDCQGIN